MITRIFLAWLPCVVLAVTLVGCQLESAPAQADAFTYKDRLGRGVNLGNALEAPQEGEWGVTLQEEYFAAIKAAGFDSVRIPIKWSGHADQEPPYTIDERFFERVDWTVEQARLNDLAAIINMHHYDEIMAQPDDHVERFLALWEQVATHYQDEPNTVYFEILNEPNTALTDSRWQTIWPQALAVIRETNPDRPVIIGPTHWNSIDDLIYLKLPDEDHNLIVTFHYYLPFEFTHQGAEWVDGSDRWLGRTWGDAPGEEAAIQNNLDRAAAWAEEHNRPLFMGEFGAYAKADIDSRAQWTAFLRAEAEQRGIAWAYWEFGAGFGVYDRGSRSWNEPLLAALIPAALDDRR